MRDRFQSTHPRAEFDMAPGARRAVSGLFQSTHPRGVRQAQPCAPMREREVSIHAPARSATGREHCHHAVVLVSIHAPARMRLLQ